jgi:hypothetical protein
MKTPDLPSPDYLRERLAYDSETGQLIWRVNKNARPSWNSRWAGQPAFTANTEGYRTGRLGGKQYLAHRVIWAIVNGQWPRGQLDHINGDRQDNRISNLRVVDNTENARNATISKGNTSGVTGVWRDTRRDRWCAEIKVNRRKIYLGSFTSLEEAAAARKQSEKDYGFHPNHGKGNKK